MPNHRKPGPLQPPTAYLPAEDSDFATTNVVPPSRMTATSNLPIRGDARHTCQTTSETTIALIKSKSMRGNPISWSSSIARDIDLTRQSSATAGGSELRREFQC